MLSVLKQAAGGMYSGITTIAWFYPATEDSNPIKIMADLELLAPG